MCGLSKWIKDYARELGFSSAGIVPAVPSPQLDAYLRWLDQGMHASMGYLDRPDRVARRKDLGVVMPGAQSLIAVTLDYRSDLPTSYKRDRSRGRISSYAWGPDYHRVMMQRLRLLASMIQGCDPGAQSSAFVDTGAILERSHAAQAQLGFVGKNTMLIHPRRGSYFFIGEIVTTLDLEVDEPAVNKMAGCGTCSRCLSACPTRAFAGPYVLDARRCISYWTIEHKGCFPRELRPLIGSWVYGCDVCQEVCPWQRFAAPSGAQASEVVDPEQAAPRLETLLTLSREQFEQRNQGTVIRRIGRDKLVGNACIAAGNSGIAGLSEHLIPLLRDPDRVVRSHAAWALGRLGQGLTSLESARSTESDVQVGQEIEDALDGRT
jgi:epoxyqueuosine reductase